MYSSKWYIAPWVLAGFVLLPTSVIIGSFFNVEFAVYSDVWGHLWRTQLPELIFNTLILTLGVALVAFFLGTSLAWLIVMYDFPGKSWLDGGLLLPMAIPGYVIGIVALDHWDYSGVVPTMLRSVFGENVWFPDIRSTIVVILALSLVLYPYIYIAARTAFRDQNQTFIDVSKCLGLNKWLIFWYCMKKL